MAERVIDLRQSAQPSRPPRAGVPARREDREHNIPLRTVNESGEHAPRKVLIAWSALEYEEQERHPYWFLIPGAAALILILIGILIQSYFFVAFVTLAFIVVVMYGNRSPRHMEFSVTKEGVFVGNTLHPFSYIKSFWIFDAMEPTELSLEVDRITMPYLRLPLGELHPNKIRAVLSDFLPEDKHKEFVSDQIARSFGF